MVPLGRLLGPLLLLKRRHWRLTITDEHIPIWIRKTFTTVVWLPNYIAVTIAGTMVNSLIDTDSVSSIFSYIATSTLHVSRRSDIGDVDIVLLSAKT